MAKKKILFVASEAAPVMKTGGLGDVAGSLPPALKELKHDVVLIIPGYRDALRMCSRAHAVAQFRMHTHEVRILETRLPNSAVRLWLVDVPALFDRLGGPYIGPDGHDWFDNGERFGLFARVVERVALNQAGLNWQPNVVHCNDWQSGLVPALLSYYPQRPATVFTIHNLAYQGTFPAETYTWLRDHYGLPLDLFSMHAMEFYGQFSFIKGGLVFADMINTVSPTYAKEILTPEFGCGLEGLLTARATRLRGILNGIDYKEWDPEQDPLLAKPFSAQQLHDKQANKFAVQEHFGLPLDAAIPLIAMIGRLVDQKGGDLVLQALPELVERYNAQFVILGTGNPALERAFLDLRAAYKQRVAAHIGFSEKMAHLIEAGADIFLMPSRFEPCGLNQMYSLHYGTIPIVRRTGGLADTVVDALDVPDHRDRANGFVFNEPTAAALTHAIERALHAFHDHSRWHAMQRRGMAEDFSWQRSAKAYDALYDEALKHARAGGAT